MNNATKNNAVTPTLSLEQKRAKDAWDKSKNYDKDHINFAKGVPALIMNSGLLQVLAFCQEKEKQQKLVADDLCQWLATQFEWVAKYQGIEDFIGKLITASPSDYQAITTEAFAWLRWLRQMAGARKANLKKGEA